MKLRDAVAVTGVVGMACSLLAGCGQKDADRIEPEKPSIKQLSVTAPSVTRPGAGPACTFAPAPVDACINPLGACQCNESFTPVPARAAGTGRCTTVSPSDGSFLWTGVVAPGATYTGAAPTTDGQGFAVVNVASTPSGYGSDGGQYGVQITFDTAGQGGVCQDLSSFSGVEVCAQGTVKNGFPVTRFVKPAAYEPDASRDMNEQQQMVWVQLINEYTAANFGSQDFEKGLCPLGQDNCTHPHFQMPISATQEVCRTITWDMFEFPYWWGRPNEGFYYPDVCMSGNQPVCAPDKIPNAPGTNDGNPSEEIARWYACSALASRAIGIGVTAVDDQSTKLVEIQNLQVRARLVP